MTRIVATARRAARSLWTAHPALTASGFAMWPVLAACLVGLVVDPREVTGAPVWLKPAKFAASIAVYALTLAWASGLVGAERPRLARRTGNVSAAMLGLEMAIIVAQAARGHASHFNVATPLDATLFAIMGIGILVQTLAAATLAVAAFRVRFADPVMGDALRWGLTLSIAGASVGPLMTRPSDSQLATMQAGARPTTIGAHTVGAPDGGAGVPGVGWSTQHGDLRVGHFVGLHAFQAIPLLAWLLGRVPAVRRRGDRARMVLGRAGAGAWGAVTAILVWQALRGIPVLEPDPPTLAALGTVVLVLAVTAGVVLRPRRHAIIATA